MVKHTSRIRTVAVHTLMYAFLILIAFVCIFPFYMLFVNATCSTLEIQNSVSFLPGKYFFENYTSLIENGLNIYRAFFNSLFIAVGASVLNVYFSALTAYAFHAYDFKGRDGIYTFMLLTMMIPGQLGFIGFYQQIVDMHLTDSYVPLIIPSIASAANVFFLRQYYTGVLSMELVEAARIDGSSEFRTFNSIVLIVSVPALATLAIGTFVGSWNNYLMPFLLLSTEEKYTMPMLVQMLKTNVYATNLGAIYTGLFITILPLLVVYLFLSKYIVQGIQLGGVKE